jgi:threonine aldolase
MSKKFIDLRSDTVTQPTSAMRDAMFSASLGDDVYGEDPTVNELQAYAADLFGLEAALFCPSGTMTNQLAIKAHTQPGDEVICDAYAHIFNYEGGGMAFNSGVQAHTIATKKGIFTPGDIAPRIRPENEHFARTSLVSIENTCNKGGGTCWELEEIKRVSAFCRSNKLPLHLDGARLFNAIVAKGYSPREIGGEFDSISVCLSKGLGAPVGSLILGSKAFIHKAHRHRKAMGGGMRQAGMLAAAGLFALKNHVDRLKTDHANADRLYEGIADLPFVEEAFVPETNLVLFRLKEGIADGEFLERLKQNGILAGTMGPRLVRFVTHLDIKKSDVETILNTLKSSANDLV